MSFFKRLFQKKEKRTIKSILNKYLTSDRDFTKIDGKSKWLIDMISEFSEFTGLPESILKTV